MRVIDFHTHVFPDKIAGMTIKKLESCANIHAFSDGTLDGLKDSMIKAGVDLSVILPVVTKPKQFQTINEFAAKLNREEEHLLSFGGIHPASEEWKQELDYIVELGLKGIKLHPDYQQEFVDSQRTIRIIQYAINHGLHVSIHAGVDVGLPNPIHCSPERSLRMINALDYDENTTGKIILAHIGGHECWNEVERDLVGKDVYFDLAFGLGKIEDEQLVRMIDNHGAERFLFATDSPWDGQKEDIDYLQNMNLSEEKREAIFHKNAERLLHLKEICI